ncbi:MAG: hypothetical protein AB7I48_16295, partial [Planctomycetaceae bacterium]
MPTSSVGGDRRKTLEALEVVGKAHPTRLDCVKSRRRPACDVETIGHRASVLCHAGNIAARVGHTLTLDA